MNGYEYINATSFTVHTEDGITDMSDRAYMLSQQIHHTMGIATEAGEVVDIYKKAMAYGKVIDPNHLREELGDLIWYIAHLAHIYGWSVEDLMQVNVNKLRARYGDRFTAHAALNRDLSLEAAVLAAGTATAAEDTP